MKRVSLAAIALGLLGLLYFEFRGSPEFRRDRALTKAENICNKGRVNEAVIEFRNPLKSDPGSADAHYEFAMALLRRADYGAAYDQLIRARERNPHLIAARVQLTNLQLRSGDIKSAREELEKF